MCFEQMDKILGRFIHGRPQKTTWSEDLQEKKIRTSAKLCLGF